MEVPAVIKTHIVSIPATYFIVFGYRQNICGIKIKRSWFFYLWAVTSMESPFRPWLEVKQNKHALFKATLMYASESIKLYITL